MIGYGALAIALLATIVAICIYLTDFLKSKKAKKNLQNTKGNIAYLISAAFVTITAGFLLTIILTNNFEYAYVFGYSARELPLAYKIASFWAGQEGSFLLWLFFHTLFGSIIIRKRAESGVMAVYSFLQLGLLSLLLYKSPFMMLAIPQPDGLGLNPLLQDPWMVIHPPILFLGYAGISVPFAYAINGLLKGNHQDWLDSGLKWGIFSFTALGAGMFIGGYWAYKVLGWGGYWGWDPVENSSLVPWLITGAFIHLLLLVKATPKAFKVVYAAIISATALVLYGTFLARSGVLSDFSTHSFVNEGIGGYLGLYMLMIATVSFLILILKWQTLPQDSKPLYPSLLSREFFLALGSLVFCVFGILVFIGMSVPLFTMAFGNPSSVNTSFYNSVSLPIALVFSILLTMVPLIRWGDNKDFSKKAFWLLAVLPGVLFAFLLELKNPMYLLIIGFSFAAIFTNIFSFIKGNISKGASLSHLGVAVLLIGIIVSSAGSVTKTVLLEENKPQQIFDNQITYLGQEKMIGGKGCYDKFSLQQPDGKVQIVRPLTKLNRDNHPAAREPGIYRSLWCDIYIEPVSHDDDDYGEEITLLQDETIVKDSLIFKFKEFKMTGSPAKGMIIESSIEVEDKNGSKQEIKPELISKNGVITGSTVEVFEQYDITLVGVNTKESKVLVGIKNKLNTQSQTFKTEISVKPLINLVWAGVFLITIGGLLSVVLRCFRR